MGANTEAQHFDIHGRVMIRVDAEAMPDAGLVEHEHEPAYTETSVRVMRGLR